MQIKWTNTLAVAAFAVAAASASAQNPDTAGTYLGFEAGAYFPVDHTIRNIFGSILPRVGLNFINNAQPDKWKPNVQFSVIGANKNGDRFLAVPVTFGVGRQFGDEKASTHPYVRAGAGVAYLDYAIGATSAHKVGFTAIGEAGVLLSDRLRLSAAYNYFSKADNFNFTGWELKLSFLFWKI